MKSDTKEKVVGVAIVATLFRAMLYSNAQASSSLKFLLGVALLVVAYTLVDCVIENTKLKQKREEQHLKAVHHYYSKMLEIEQNDPRRLKNIEDIDEFMAVYKKYKENQTNAKKKNL